VKSLSIAIAVAVALGTTGCSKWFWGGAAAAGAAGAGAYEYSNREALEDLEDDYEDGRISREEYERRKDESEDRSVVY